MIAAMRCLTPAPRVCSVGHAAAITGEHTKLASAAFIADWPTREPEMGLGLAEIPSQVKVLYSALAHLPSLADRLQSLPCHWSSLPPAAECNQIFLLIVSQCRLDPWFCNLVLLLSKPPKCAAHLQRVKKYLTVLSPCPPARHSRANAATPAPHLHKAAHH